jgi:hypothetical protein
MPTKYRKKPVVIEAVQWTGSNLHEIQAFAGPNTHLLYPEEQALYVRTLEGGHKASKGDWIIKGVKGEFYPCKPDIFEATYEKVD